MRRNIGKDEIEQALEELNKSKTFGNSERNLHILRFLVSAYLENSYVKESVLELELFQGKDQSISYDGKVRVYMFNLRKKLDEYYRTEGAHDKLIFTIKKGQYNLTVARRVKNNKPHKSQYKLYIPILFLLPLALLIMLTRNVYHTTYCWEPFLNNGSPNLCCVGDHFIIVGKDQDGTRLTAYKGNLNSEQDFEAFIQSDTGRYSHFAKAPFSFVTKMGPVSSARLAAWFSAHHSNLSVAMESEMAPDAINKNNIVYIGPFRTMDFFSGLFLKDSRVFGYDGQNIMNKKTGRIIRASTEQNRRTDQVMVSYKRLNDTGQYILFFAANNDIGVLAAVKNFTNPVWLKKFYENLPSKDAQYNALFTVRGIGRTELNCELIQIEILH